MSKSHGIIVIITYAVHRKNTMDGILRFGSKVIITIFALNPVISDFITQGDDYLFVMITSL